MTDPVERWRLILGSTADRSCGGLSGASAARDAALDWLYEGHGGAEQHARGERSGGLADSQLTTVDWLDQVHTLFPKRTIERLERDAVERYGLVDVLTNPDALQRVEPSVDLLGAVLRTKHLMNATVLAMARQLVRKVIEDLIARLALEVRQAFHGGRSRRRTLLRRSATFDVRRTLRANLAHYDPQRRRIVVQEPQFSARTRRTLDRWQVLLLVDQSASMASSVIHSAVTASCLWGLPGIKTHLIAFDTSVVDLTSDVDDPVELLMKVQLGGGTDIGGAVGYAAGLIEVPRRAIVVVVSDFFEGADDARLVREIAALVGQGSTVLCLAALDEAANPAYDRDMAQRLANAGAHVGAMTPGQLATFVAEKVCR